MRIAMLFVFASNVAVAVGSMAVLPARVAIHFGLGGQPDGWATSYVHAALLSGFLAFLLAVFLFKSSPGLVGNRVYVISDNGKGYVLEPGPTEGKRVGETNLGEPCVTSPAFLDGQIFLRGEKHLFCLGDAAGK